MHYIKVLTAAILLMIAAMAVQLACTSSVTPAQFEVTSLDITPAQVTVGETAKISAEVINTGNAGGVYYATLSVDGEKISTKDINMEPGETRTVSFSLSKDNAGSYEIRIGKRSATLTVNAKLIARQMELAYDDGVAKDYLSLVKPATGYSVSFVSPPELFTVSKVRVYGLVYGSPGFHIADSELQIWDKDKKVLYTTNFPGEQFPLVTRLGDNTGSTGGWADIEIPNVKVQGNFIVHIYTGTPAGQGFKMGAASNVTNTYSNVTVRGEDGSDTLASSWPYTAVYWYGDRSRVNWMVRVTGNAMVPQ